MGLGGKGEHLADLLDHHLKQNSIQVLKVVIQARLTQPGPSGDVSGTQALDPFVIHQFGGRRHDLLFGPVSLDPP